MLIYDPANSVHAPGAAGTSLAGNGVKMLQHEAVPSATSFDVQGRVDINAPWVKIGSTVAASAPAAFIVLNDTYANVRIVRSGTGNFKVWAK